jgi:hypothetical protein
MESIPSLWLQAGHSVGAGGQLVERWSFGRPGLPSPSIAPAASRSGGGARPAAKAARPCFQYRCISTRVWLFPASSVGSIKMSLDDSGAKQPPTAPSTKSEMAGLIASKDWSTTALGDPNNWSPSLKLIVGIMTASGFPMAVRWGPELILIYNDGYRTILADKHPRALGLPFRVVWPEVVSELLSLQQAILAGESPAFIPKTGLSQFGAAARAGRRRILPSVTVR